MCRCLGLLLALLPAFGLSAMPQTFRDYECETTLTVSGSRPITFMKDVVARADLIVRAGIGRSTSYLSEDAREIFTTYELVTPRVLFTSPSVPPRFGLDSAGSLLMAQQGGTIFRDGRTDCPLSMSVSESTTLQRGMDVVLLLSMWKGQFYGFDGVFEVRDSKIVLPKAEPSDGEQFKGMPVDRFIARVLTIKNGR
jgi:hypothetical protein